MSTVAITGNTYPVKDQIKALGGRWNAGEKCWMVPAEKADAAKSMVSGAPRQSFEKSSYGQRKCCKCGHPVTGNYSTCKDCYYHAQECKALGLDENWDA